MPAFIGYRSLAGALEATLNGINMSANGGEST
jgi:hypothetical protein